MTHRKVYVFFIIVLFQFGCNPKASKKTVEFNSFSIEISESWTYIKQQGMDSFVGAFSTSVLDTITFDLGMYSNDLSEDTRVRPLARKMDYKDVLDTEPYSNIIFSDNYDEDIKFGLHLKNYYYYDVIDGYKAKIVMPKNKIGTTGLYIDSLNSNGIQFTIYGTNLKIESRNELKEAFKTLRFKVK